MPKKDMSQSWGKPPEQRRVFSIEEFCAEYRISPARYFSMKRMGQGPREMKLGSRTLIRVAAADEWERAIEDETEAAKAAKRAKAAEGEEEKTDG
jgi:hypothetical protein